MPRYEYSEGGDEDSCATKSKAALCTKKGVGILGLLVAGVATAAVLAVHASTGAAANTCDPDAPGGCNVCAQCCKAYIPSERECAQCLSAEGCASNSRNGTSPATSSGFDCAARAADGVRYL